MNTYLPSNIFRAYDIRGTAEPTAKKPQPDLTPENVYLIGRGAATYLRRQYNCQHLVVGRDNRTHGQDLQEAFIRGALDSGLTVTNIGLATSPLVYWATCSSQRSEQLPYDCGVNITASHNPATDNGIKIVAQNAHSIADQELQQILQIIQSGDFIHTDTPAKLHHHQAFFDLYLEDITAKIQLARPLKVVIDSGNGVTGIFAPRLFRAVGCEVIELYTELDGRFPNHEANPEHAKNLLEAGEAVRLSAADLGIGFDGDGDRVGFLDENGLHYTSEFPIMLLARDLLSRHPGEKVIFDVKVSEILPRDVVQHGGHPIMSRTGHSYMENRLKFEQASLAGEKSGHFFFGQNFNFYGFDDALFAGIKVAEILSQKPLTFSDHFADLPKLPGIPELKLFCPDEQKFAVIDAIKEAFINTHECITIDGIRVKFSDTNWGLIRASNTSPYLTTHFEAATPEELEQIKSLLLDQARRFPEVQIPE